MSKNESRPKGTTRRRGSAYQKRFMTTIIPFASDVERMGVHRAPVMASTPNSAAAKAYQLL